MDRWQIAISHIFKGARFEEGTLDVNVLGELAAYRELVLEVARTLWRRDNPARIRLPNGFADDFALRLSSLERGCAIATLERTVPAPAQLGFNNRGETFERSMQLVEECLRAVGEGKQLPSDFPRSALPGFRGWGSSLLEDESVELRNSTGTVVASYNPDARAALLDRIATSYEDSADEIGYVLATSIRAGRFELYTSRTSGDGVDVPLDAQHEQQVVQALANHDDVRLRVVGTGAYSAQGGLVRFTKVDRLEQADQSVSNTGLWAAMDEITRSIDDESWSKLPADGAENHDAYLS